MDDSRKNDKSKGLKKSQAEKALQRLRTETALQRQQNIFEQRAKPQGFLESLNPLRAIRRAKEETDALTELTNANTRLVDANSNYVAATARNQSAAEIAQERIDSEIKAERAMGEKLEQEARLARIEAERKALELQQQVQHQEAEIAREKRNEASMQEIDDLDFELAKKKRLLELHQLNQALAASSAPDTTTQAGQRTPGPELYALVERSESRAVIEEHCNDERMIWKRKFERGAISEERYEDKMAEIEADERWATQALENRLDQDL